MYGIKFLPKPVEFSSLQEIENEVTKKGISKTSIEPRFLTSALLKFLEVLDGLCGLL